MRVLVVNAGSSSLKLRVVQADDTVSWSRDLGPDDGLPDEAFDVDVVGHRVVHGGVEFTSAVLLDDDVVRRLEELTALAPLHQPAALRGMRQVSERLPGVPSVACFDTSFHATMPAAASTYALPAQWRERYPLRRFGFHGLSHAYATRRAGELLRRPAEELLLVTCHLGAGASLTAVRHGHSVDTTMGFTPLEGVVMATRSGTVDPGLPLWLQQQTGMSAGEVLDQLEHESGLRGLAGTPDMREVLARDDDRTRLALEVYLWRLRAGMAAMAASAGGVDAVVFTGGVGENAPAVRAGAVEGLGFLGLGIDRGRNDAAAGDADVSADGARVRTLVVHAREELQIAKETRALLA